MKIVVLVSVIVLAMPFYGDIASPSYSSWKLHYSKARDLAVDGQNQEAIKEARLSVLESRNRHGQETLNTEKSLELVATLARKTGNYPYATRLISKAYDVNCRIQGKTDTNSIRLLSDLGCLAVLSGDLKGARAHYDEALKTCELANRMACITAAEPMLGLAHLMALGGNFSASEKLYNSAIDRLCCFSKYRPELRIKLASALENLGKIYESQGNYSYAVKCFERSKCVYQSQGTRQIEKLVHTFLCMGDTYAKWGKPERAIKSYKDALVILDNHSDADSTVLAGVVLKSLGDTFRKKGNLELASNYYKKAVIHFETNASSGQRPLLLETTKSLSDVYKSMGLDSEARAIRVKTLAMD
ncbi:MAG: tetratricopeptide repeat protein [Desulfomonilaceae bacterium]